MEKFKVCTKCGETKPMTIEYFGIRATGKNGFKSSCKKCEILYYRQYKKDNKERIDKYAQDNKAHLSECRKQYRIRNKESIAKSSKIYAIENKEHLAAYKNKYYKANKEKMCDRAHKYYEDNKAYVIVKKKIYNEKNKEYLDYYSKQYRIDNKEKIKNRMLIYSKKHKAHISNYNSIYREKNKESIKVWHDKYRKNNKTYFSDYSKKYLKTHREDFKINGEKRRSLKMSLPSTLTKFQWENIKLHFDYKCAYCNKELPLAQEHFKPLINGGEYTINNIICSCKTCNSSKGSKPFETWYPNYKYYSRKREKNILEFLGYKNSNQQLKII